jgi:DNA topoisomerase-1
LNGRYGPYITNKLKNAKIPKDRIPKELTLDECQALLAAAPERRGRGMKRKPAPVAAAQSAADAAAEAKLPAEKKKKKKKKKKRAAPRKRAEPSPAESGETADEPPAE